MLVAMDIKVFLRVAADGPYLLLKSTRWWTCFTEASGGFTGFHAFHPFVMFSDTRDI